FPRAMRTARNAARIGRPSPCPAMRPCGIVQIARPRARDREGTQVRPLRSETSTWIASCGPALRQRTCRGGIMEETAAVSDLESLLLSEGVVTEQQLERAIRIRDRMAKTRRPGEILVEMGQLARAEYDRIVRLHRSQLDLAQILHEDGVLDDARLAT